MKHVILNREFGVVRTVAVFGPGRGGTSVIAGCLRALGVCMGTSLHPYKHEWSPILRRPDGSVDLPATQQTIEQMNTSYPWWGWKFPSDVFHLEAVMPLLRHPGFIVVTRDLTKIALSSLARQDVPFEISLYEAAKVARYIADRMRFWPFPTLVVPFAETLQRPNALVEMLCAFLQIDPDEEKRKQAADFVQPLTQGYRPFDARPDQLHDFSPAQDNLMDSQLLAVDFSTRYSKEYLQHFERLLPQAKAETNQLAVRIKSAQQLQIASEILNELRDLFASCGVVQLRIDKAESIAAKEWRVAVDKALDRIAVVAQKASQEARHSTGNYDGVNRLYCALLLLIRVRTALAAGAHRLTLPQA